MTSDKNLEKIGQFFDRYKLFMLGCIAVAFQIFVYTNNYQLFRLSTSDTAVLGLACCSLISVYQLTKLHKTGEGLKEPLFWYSYFSQNFVWICFGLLSSSLTVLAINIIFPFWIWGTFSKGNKWKWRILVCGIVLAVLSAFLLLQSEASKNIQISLVLFEVMGVACSLTIFFGELVQKKRNPHLRKPPVLRSTLTALLASGGWAYWAYYQSHLFILSVNIFLMLSMVGTYLLERKHQQKLSFS